MNTSEFFSIQHGGNSPSIKPNMAILLHKTNSIGSFAAQEDFVASLHNFIVDENNDSVIGAGQLLSKMDIEDLLRSMLRLGEHRARVLPNNILSISDVHIAWVVPAQVRPMIFNITGMPLKTINVPWPRLLIMATINGSLAVAALKGTRKPTEKTTLFNAPLMNVNNIGSVCTGTAEIPRFCNPDSLLAWESVLFDTAFSHVNNTNTLNFDIEKSKESNTGVSSKDHFKYWLALSRKKANIFPNDQLVPMRMNIGDFLSRHSR
ncbi:MAG: PRTRC system protein B [Methylococcales bacterium]